MNTRGEALNLCIEWLACEASYQCAKDESVNLARAGQRLRDITQYEVPEHWSRYRRFTQQDAPARATQAIMKACVAAHTGVVIDNMLLGGSYDLSHSAALQTLREAEPAILDCHDLLRARLDLPFDAAMGRMSYGEQTLCYGYLTMAGLAVAHVMKGAEQGGALWLPEPGHPSGDVVDWQR